MLLFLCYVYIAFKYVYNVIGYFNFCNGSFFILRFAFNSIGVSIAFLSSLQLILIFFSAEKESLDDTMLSSRLLFRTVMATLSLAIFYVPWH